ncbi:hypothetical protein KDN34_16225 [Shewanella yunxiaonensis]|uniref:Lipoprotein n=1 Tax=Shewanella yunxiaonensis TaxID=2829809 RepID=A0ABX7YSE0_9GAMM|nr:hypothetical protein [Shewanella yunxiaonensis]QUN05703.1 hypothetical protein KDN34_16225 [Shewanella yunxiaonensis]
MELKFIKLTACVGMAMLLGACSATTSLTAMQPDTTIYIKDAKGQDAPRTETLPTTSFGHYAFKAIQPGQQPFYGVLPLKFNGGYLATDIILFAPAAFFNLREVFPYYQFDVAKQCLRYRKSEQDNWVEYVPTAAEKQRAETWFKQSGITPVTVTAKDNQ